MFPPRTHPLGGCARAVEHAVSVGGYAVSVGEDAVSVGGYAVRVGEDAVFRSTLDCIKGLIGVDDSGPGAAGGPSLGEGAPVGTLDMLSAEAGQPNDHQYADLCTRTQTSNKKVQCNNNKFSSFFQVSSLGKTFIHSRQQTSLRSRALNAASASRW